MNGRKGNANKRFVIVRKKFWRQCWQFPVQNLPTENRAPTSLTDTGTQVYKNGLGNDAYNRT
jgi:hypothetical protein